jgi:hypothetical protein
VDKEAGGEPDKDVEQAERQGEGKAERQDEKWIKRQAESRTKTWSRQRGIQRACREAELTVEHKESRQSVRERCFLPWGMRVRIVLHRERFSPSKKIQERCRTCRLCSYYFNGWVVFVLHTQIMIM